MPKNVDAIALFFIVSALLFTGFVMDHGPVCVARRQMALSDHGGRHRYMMLPRVPAPPALSRLPALPPLPRI